MSVSRRLQRRQDEVDPLNCQLCSDFFGDNILTCNQDGVLTWFVHICWFSPQSFR